MVEKKEVESVIEDYIKFLEKLHKIWWDVEDRQLLYQKLEELDKMLIEETKKLRTDLKGGIEKNGKNESRGEIPQH